MKLTGENRRIRGKIGPSATLSTINPTWTDPGSNPGFRGERPATNRLSHGVTNADINITAELKARRKVFNKIWNRVSFVIPE
jgi:hypothetical protein